MVLCNHYCEKVLLACKKDVKQNANAIKCNTLLFEESY